MWMWNKYKPCKWFYRTCNWTNSKTKWRLPLLQFPPWRRFPCSPAFHTFHTFDTSTCDVEKNERRFTWRESLETGMWSGNDFLLRVRHVDISRVLEASSLRTWRRTEEKWHVARRVCEMCVCVWDVCVRDGERGGSALCCRPRRACCCNWLSD